MSTIIDLNTQINAFNDMYTAYTNCSSLSNCSNPGGFDTTYGTANDTARKSLIDASYNAIVTNIKKTIKDGAGNEIINGATVFSSVNETNENSGVFGNTVSTGSYYSNYDNSYNLIINNNIKNIKSQKDLEMKIKELEQLPNTIYAEKKKYNDYTIYTNIILTTLITCIIFIIFTKL